MGIKKGDLIDERKRHPQSCGLVVKVMGGGEGFEKIVCCEHELTAEDVVPSVAVAKGRKRGQMPAAIVLDVSLPDIDGWKILERLKDDPATRHIPIYIISADDDKERGLRSGAVSFVTKPASPEMLAGPVAGSNRPRGILVKNRLSGSPGSMPRTDS